MVMIINDYYDHHHPILSLYSYEGGDEHPYSLDKHNAIASLRYVMSFYACVINSSRCYLKIIVIILITTIIIIITITIRCSFQDVQG